MRTISGMTTKKGCSNKDKAKEERKKLVGAAFASAWFERDEERDMAVESFAKANLTIQEILMLTEGLREITRNASKTKSRIFGSNSRVMGGIA
jgi:hypothetical protein